MQGIVRYVHQKSGDIVKYRVSTDVEGDKERFEDRKQNADEEHRAKYIKGLVFEVVEITDNLNERYVYYALPQSDRITYDKTVVDYIQEPKVEKRIRRALDWTIEHFPEEQFSYMFFVGSNENKKNVKVMIFKDGEKFEAYTFVGTKQPVERVFLGG